MRETKAEFRSAKEFRDWLESHHNSVKVLWMIFRKGAEKKASLSYEEALKEALCYGWIDSIIKKIDDEKYLRKFTPRTNIDNWSKKNIGIMKQLIANGRMTEHGRKKISDKILNQTDGSKVEPVLDEKTKAMFKANRKAWNNLQNLAPSYRKQYIGWIQSAKKENTRIKRAERAIALLAEGKKLGEK